MDDLQAAFGKENWEELVENQIGNILPLRAHSDGLCADVHGEDFSSPDPGSRTPGWLVEKDEEEEQECECYADRLILGEFLNTSRFVVDVFRANSYSCEYQHAHSHSQASDHEQEFPAISVNGPDSVQSE